MKYISKPKLLKAFGKNLARIRKEKKVSQEKLSFEIEMDVTSISKIERGILNVSVYNAYKIAHALDVDLKQLFEIETK